MRGSVCVRLKELSREGPPCWVRGGGLMKGFCENGCALSLLFAPLCCLNFVGSTLLPSAALPDLQLWPPNVFLFSSPLLFLLRKKFGAITKQIFVLELLLNFHFGIYFIRLITCYLAAYALLNMFPWSYISSFAPEKFQVIILFYL